MSVYVPAGSGESRWVVGDTYRFTATAAMTGGALAVLEASVPPGSGPPPHVHANEDEAFYVLGGRLEISTEEETFTAGAGDFVFVPRGTPHHFTNVGVDAARALILLTPGGFERFFLDVGVPAQAGQQAPPVPADDLRRMVQRAPHYGAQILIPHAGEADAGVPSDGGPNAIAREDDAGTLFAAIDSMNLDDILKHFADDARVAFGNSEPMAGSQAITAGMGAFFATIAGLRHGVTRQWRVGPDTIAETDVTYQRLDGDSVRVPAVSIWHTRGDGLIDDYRVFIDLAPVYAG